jgi:hypothetical protein
MPLICAPRPFNDGGVWTPGWFDIGNWLPPTDIHTLSVSSPVDWPAGWLHQKLVTCGGPLATALAAATISRPTEACTAPKASVFRPDSSSI